MKLEEKNGLRILTPKEGYKLQRKGEDNNFSEIVYLGKNDSEENYKEITEAEAQAIINAKESNDSELSEALDVANAQDVTEFVEEYSELTPVSPRSKKFLVQAGKQYYNDKDNRIVSEFDGFTESNPAATILSSQPLAFEGDNVLTPSETPDSEYILYTLRYMQTSDIKFVIAVTATAMDAPQGGLKGEDIN